MESVGCHDHRTPRSIGVRMSHVAIVETGITKPVLAQSTAPVIKLVASLGREVEPHEGAHQILDSAGKGRVGVKNFAALAAGEDADTHHVFAPLDRCAVVEAGTAGGDVILPERHAKIEIEITAVRGDPRKAPAYNPLDLLDALERRA